MEDGSLILVAGALLALGIAASLVAGRLRVPGLVLVLALGMLIGSRRARADRLRRRHRGRGAGAQRSGSSRSALILFEGGLAAGWGEIRPVLGVSLSLATVGTVATAAIVGLSASWLLDLTTLEGLLLGSIVAATDSAAIFSVLRGSSVEKRLARALEGESGFNDPVAIVLVLGFIEYIQRARLRRLRTWSCWRWGSWESARSWASRSGDSRSWASASAQVSTTGLYPVASIAAAALAFGAADVLHGSGFIAVYLAGLALGSAAIPGKRTIEDFHDGLAWISQIAMFLTLGLLVNPSDFGDIVGEALLIAAVLMFVARPLAAFLATAGARLNLRESALVGWAGLRGAVPIVLATFPVIEGVDERGVVLQHRLLRGPDLHADPGRHVRAARARPGRDHRRARALAARCMRWAPSGGSAPRCSSTRSRESDADRGPEREPARAAARGAGQRDRARRRGAAAPRLDRDRGRRPAAHPGARPRARRRRGAVRPLAVGPDRGARAQAPAPTAGRSPIFSVQPVARGDGRPGSPERIEGVEVLRAAAHAARAAGRAGAAGRRPAGRHRRGRGGRRRRAPAVPLLPRAHRPRARPGAARAWWQEVAGVVSQTTVR